MNGEHDLRPDLERLQRAALIAGVAGIAACFAGGWFSRGPFFHSYLTAYLFWLGPALGSMAILMLHHLVGGGWGFLIRRQLEASIGTLPVMALLILPLLLGLQELYPWTRPEAASDELMHLKAPYLNMPFFLARLVAYFAAWLLFSHLLTKWSLEQDRTGDPALMQRLQLLSGPGIVVYGLTVTFASIDWVMSLEPHWYSTIYGMIYMVGQALSTIAFAILMARWLARRPPLEELATPEHFRDVGNLLLTFVILWAYVGFSQFLITWSGNLAEEIPWYLRRARNSWYWVGALLLLFHFFVPFFLLLSRGVKDRAERLAKVAAAVLVMRMVDQFWLVEPAFHPQGIAVHWMNLAATIGIGGLWLAAFLARLKRAPLVPLHDPRLERMEVESA